jgi:hypothetical protein
MHQTDGSNVCFVGTRALFRTIMLKNITFDRSCVAASGQSSVKYICMYECMFNDRNFRSLRSHRFAYGRKG